MCDHHCLLSCYGASIYLQVGCLEMPALPDPPMLWEDKKKKEASFCSCHFDMQVIVI
jgi:hypothetical protein